MFARLIHFIFGKPSESLPLIRGNKIESTSGGPITIVEEKTRDFGPYRKGHTSHPDDCGFIKGWKLWVKDCGDVWNKSVALPPSPKETLRIIEHFEKQIEDLTKEKEPKEEGTTVEMWLARDKTDGQPTYLFTCEPDYKDGVFRGSISRYVLVDQHFGLEPGQKRKVKATFEDEE